MESKAKLFVAFAITLFAVSNGAIECDVCSESYSFEAAAVTQTWLNSEMPSSGGMKYVDMFAMSETDRPCANLKPADRVMSCAATDALCYTKKIRTDFTYSLGSANHAFSISETARGCFKKLIDDDDDDDDDDDCGDMDDMDETTMAETTMEPTTEDANTTEDAVTSDRERREATTETTANTTMDANTTMTTAAGTGSTAATTQDPNTAKIMECMTKNTGSEAQETCLCNVYNTLFCDAMMNPKETVCGTGTTTTPAPTTTDPGMPVMTRKVPGCEVGCFMPGKGGSLFKERLVKLAVTLADLIAAHATTPAPARERRAVGDMIDLPAGVDQTSLEASIASEYNTMDGFLGVIVDGYIPDADGLTGTVVFRLNFAPTATVDEAAVAAAATAFVDGNNFATGSSVEVVPWVEPVLVAGGSSSGAKDIILNFGLLLCLGAFAMF